MRIVHLSDLHLGFRQYTRSASNGLNQRDVDVARTFAGVIDDVIAIAPDLVVIAGDVFHSVRPSNPCLLHAFKQLKRLQDALPELTTVIAAGNHDLPRTADAGCILRLFQEIPGVFVADAGARVLHDRAAHVFAVPDIAGMARPELRLPLHEVPRILVLHGEVAGALPLGLSRNENEIPVADLHLDEWDYVALGHYHVSTEVAPNCFYAGSIDYTSTDPWGEQRSECKAGLSGKSFIEYDTETRTMTRHMVRGVRPLIDLPAIEADGLSAAEVDAAIASAVAGCAIEGAVVRCQIRDIPVTVRRDLNVTAIREYKRRAFAFTLDYRTPTRYSTTIARGAPGRRPNLGEMFAARLTKNIEGTDLDAGGIAALGRKYLDQAEEVAVPIEAEA